jgi:hypothetical protein
MRGLAAHGLLGAILLLTGCAVGGGDTPKRPAVAVADEVGVVEQSRIVGTWRCRELNPYPELPRQTITSTYNADGTYVGEGVTEARPPFGAMRAKVTGRWAVEGDRIVTSDVETEAGSDDAWTNMMAGIGASIVNSFGQEQTRGVGDVLKLDRDELVLRAVGVEDPPIFSCTR